MNVERQNKALVLIFFFVGTALFYFNNTYLSLGPASISIRYLIGMVLIGIAILYCLVRPEPLFLKEIAKDGMVVFLPYLVLLFFSMMIWVARFSSLSIISRGGFSVVYQAIGLGVALSYIVVFKEKAVYIQLASMIVAELIFIIISSVMELGIGGFIRAYIDLIMSFGSSKAEGFSTVELNEICYAFGLYLVFLLIKKGPIKHRLFLVMMTLFLSSVGLKRIVIAALAASLFLTIFCRLMPGQMSARTVNIFKVILMLFSWAYVVSVKTGLFNDLAAYFDIDTMGRVDINEFIDSYYKISPLFGGYGLGYIVRLLQSGAFRANRWLEALHNDLLRIYIEVGFWGFFAWVYSFWGYRLSYFTKNRSKETLLIAFACILYCFITYLTDNSCFYFYTNIAAFTLILSCVCHDIKEKDLERRKLLVSDSSGL